MVNNNCGTDCNFDKKRQEQIYRDSVPSNVDIPIYDNFAESKMQDEIVVSFVANKISRIQPTTGVSETNPSIYNRSFLPRFLAEAKLPGWDAHSEYVPLESFDSNFDLSFEVSQEGGDLLRIMQIFTTALKHVIDYLGSKIDTASTNTAKKEIMIKLQGSATPLTPAKTVEVSLDDILRGNYDKRYSFLAGRSVIKTQDFAQLMRASALSRLLRF